MYPKKAFSETVLKAYIMKTLNNSPKSKAKGKSVTKSVTIPGNWTFKSTYGIYAIHIDNCNTEKALRKKQCSIFCNIIPFCKSLSVSRSAQSGKELNRNIKTYLFEDTGLSKNQMVFQTSRFTTHATKIWHFVLNHVLLSGMQKN